MATGRRSKRSKVKGHVGTAIQHSYLCRNQAAPWPRRCAPRSGFCLVRPASSCWIAYVRSWVIDKQAKKMQPVQVVVGEASPGLGLVVVVALSGGDVDEPWKKRQLFICGVPCVRLLSDDEDWDSESRRRTCSSTQGAAKQPFSHHGPSRPRKSQNSFDQSWAASRRCNCTQ